MKAFFSLKSTIRTLFVAVMALATASCGFHLRGNYMLPDDIAKLSLTSFDRYGQLTRLVESQFKMHGIESVPPSAKVPNLHLISESTGKRTLSLYQNSRAAEYELTYSVRYSIVVPDKGAQTYTTKVNRTFLDNPLTALAKSVERDMIEDEMRQQASRQIMRQLARLTAVFDKMEEEKLEAELDAMMEDSANALSETTVTTEAEGDTQAGNALFADETTPSNKTE
ncbi:LPS assembly lipoprotein LptE [Photobacterium sp. SDRW27]|uniref:LPS-assembly lipoprotein LptE n=1 Tax=Photobacterium obscurum TaxID=2829490 RepID=UPI0022447EB2|nr:LPS assembly lipoprotein LptE [Photobacterium obscurum]MCW8331799.1 LPS assembly lipoprotein LptE [Photobacterium obscurum]